MFTYCSNLTNQLSPNVFSVDTVLVRGRHDEMISNFLVAIDSPIENGYPEQSVICKDGETYYVRLKVESESLIPIKAEKKRNMTSIFEKKTTEGCMTLIGTRNIFMNSEMRDKQFLEIGLSVFKASVAAHGLDPLTATENIRDFNDNYHQCTIAEWEQIIMDMEINGVMLWKEKCIKQAQVDAATTIAEINSITWD